MERAWWRVACLSLCLAGAASCADDSSGRDPGSSGAKDAGGATGGTGGATGGTGGRSGAGGADDDGGAGQVFNVEPEALQTLTYDLGGAAPTLTFNATLDGAPIAVGWNVDRGDVATIEAGPAESAVFTPSGKGGGLVVVRAGLNGEVVERKVWVQIVATQNGIDTSSTAQQQQVADTLAELTAGGGVGGVGGEGLGVAVSDDGVRDRLDAPTEDGSAESLRLLYPYDGTVWPRGMLAPLLMWDSSLGGVDAIKIELESSGGSVHWSGSFGPPAILAQSGGSFTRHPIPQDAWALATNSAGGVTPDGSPDRLTVKLTVEKAGTAYGPITQSWTVASARLSGTIYYNSYGTNLAKNLGGAVGGDGMFGGAVLSIRVGDTGPALVAGTDGNDSNCRVCHSVAAEGSRLVAVRGDYSTSSAYAISPMGVTEAAMGTVVSYPGLTPDGRYALSAAGQLLDLDNASMAVAVTGLGTVASNLGTPSFAHDGKKIAFNPSASGSITDPTHKLVVMDFDPAALAFSNPVTVVDESPAGGDRRPGWPAFTPDGMVVFHQQVTAGSDGNGEPDLHTRKGAKAYLAWTPASAAQPTPLDQLNGRAPGGASYLPTLAAPAALACTGDGTQVGGLDADHADDANLNYEPTVSPISVGGYSWVVFTSRRMYGSVASIPPYCSDPRGVDLIQNVTPKKLWVAAVDLNAAPGSDPSHPAFYLPAQELLAGNARGFWVLDPCRADGASCETGDQCCNGFCSTGDDGALVCVAEPPDGACSKLQEHCDSAADCCDKSLACINHFCTITGPT